MQSSVSLITFSQFICNFAGSKGGAIESAIANPLQIFATSLIKNYAQLKGGAIAVDGFVVLDSNLFKENTAYYGSGGAVSLISSLEYDSIFTGCIFQENLSGLSGGAIYYFILLKPIEPISFSSTYCFFLSNAAHV